MDRDAAPDSWKVTGYTLLRVGIGVSLVFHAVPMLWRLPAFVDRVRALFAPTALPDWAVVPFAWLIPPVEVALGVLTVLGVWTRTVVALSMGWMIALLAGSNLLERTDLILPGLAYLVVYFLLLQFVEQNVVSLDRLVRGDRG
jgi:thiosulfate dehydrogenase [quinone] large subunit